MDWIPFVFLGVVGGIGLVIWLVASHREKKRRERVIQLAKELDLELNWILPDQEQGVFGQFQVVQKGRNRTTNLCLIADDGETRIALFDYSFITGAGENQRRHHWVVSLCRMDALDAPAMQLKPTTFLSLVGSLIGFQDIHIPEAPEFSKAFVIQGNAPEAIRQFLNAARRDAFLRDPKQTYALLNRHLLIVRENQKLNAPKIKPLLGESLALIQSLCRTN
ncbi:MAG: hypothetical protein ACK57G_10175 [Planctomycetota bacterium]|jgi:hypothetical protein